MKLDIRQKHEFNQLMPIESIGTTAYKYFRCRCGVDSRKSYIKFKNTEFVCLSCGGEFRYVYMGYDQIGQLSESKLRKAIKLAQKQLKEYI